MPEKEQKNCKKNWQRGLRKITQLIDLEAKKVESNTFKHKTMV